MNLLDGPLLTDQDNYFPAVVAFWSIAATLVVLWAVAAYRKRKYATRLFGMIVVIGAAVVWCLAEWEDLNQQESAGHLSLEHFLIVGFLLLMVGALILFGITAAGKVWRQEAEDGKALEAVGIVADREAGWAGVRWVVFGISTLLCGWWWFSAGGAAPIVVDGMLGLVLLSIGQEPRQNASPAAPGPLGHAGIATSADLHQAGMTGAQFGRGIRLGFDKWTGEVIRYTPRDGHGLICAPTGTGKNRDFLTGALLEWQGSAIVIDPKGALCAITQRQRRNIGKVIVLNPFEGNKKVFPANMRLQKSSTYNPMALLEPDAPGFTIGCERLADGISGDDKHGDENASHFRDKAQDLIAGVIMQVASAPLYAPRRNLSTVRDILTSANGENLFTFAEAASAAGGNFYIAQKLASYGEPGAQGNKEVDGVVSTAKRYTKFIGNETIGPNLCGEGFRFAALKETPTTVFVILPMEYMDACGQWFRLIVASALHELWREGRGKVPVLMMLDEFSQFGSLGVVKSAMNAARNYGVQLLPVVQQLSDLETLYGRSWGSFVNGAAFKVFYASDDIATRDYVEKISGLKTVRTPNVSVGTSAGGTSTNVGYGLTQQPVKAGYEVGEIPSNEFLMRARGVNNIIEAMRAPYFDRRWCSELQGLYDPDPYERREGMG